VILFQFYLTKFKLKYLKFDLSSKEKDKSTDEKFFASIEFDFFRVNSSLLLEYGP